MQRIVGIGEIVISNNIEDTIKTFALASCIGVVAYSSFRKVGGMIHRALPSPTLGRENNVKCCYYASIGIPYLINQMCREYGCLKGELSISLYGGASSIRSDDIFNVGRKNIEATKNILSEMNLKFNETETGKSVSRTIELHVITGEVVVAYQQIKI